VRGERKGLFQQWARILRPKRVGDKGALPGEPKKNVHGKRCTYGGGYSGRKRLRTGHKSKKKMVVAKKICGSDTLKKDNKKGNGNRPEEDRKKGGVSAGSLDCLVQEERNRQRMQNLEERTTEKQQGGV